MSRNRREPNHNEKVRPVQLGRTYTFPITGLGHSGEGVGRVEGFTVFVRYALPEETVTVVIEEVRANFARGRLIRVETSDPQRVSPLCPVYEACGGCQLQHLSYAGQLAAKYQSVQDAMQRIGKLADVTIKPVLGMDDPWRYRNKAQFPVGRMGEKIVTGCFAAGSHEIIPTDNCLIQHSLNDRLLTAVRRIAASVGVAPYDEKTGQGVLRHVMGRVGSATGEVMAVLVTAARDFPGNEELVQQLKAAIPELTSIQQNINQARTNVILGRETRVLWGTPVIHDHIGRFSFQISAESFFQVNAVQTQVLYEKAVQAAGLTGGETVFDLYSGTGTISLFLAEHSTQVYGIEYSPAAVADAERNATANKIHNVQFIAGDVAAKIVELQKKGIRPDVIVLDPPRAGCEEIVLKTAAEMGPTRMVYVSCNPATLARDLALLDEMGYKTVEIQPVDMFPQTYHVECVVLLERKHATV
ncbi:MAG TPA: 23S rRNA (uracil(1939)-C(5))-methyltransferase RlmD [Negativicutes bacterium]|nr:23S rRNA (uracil(1939)-C(5))-methyltransferase RlmD [Negativicutes bacterium]